DPEKRYTVWTGLLGGLFLALSYFGTDQSQVQRYLGGKNTTESKMGLMFNAVLKIPMQFFILLTGALIYVFYIFYQPPLHFNEASVKIVNEAGKSKEVAQLKSEFKSLIEQRKNSALDYRDALSNSVDGELAEQKLIEISKAVESKRAEMKALITSVDDSIKTKDSDYVFLTFILNYLPHGLIGLLIAVIFSAAMSSTSSEISALASTTVVDFYKNVIHRNGTEHGYLIASKWLTVLWGCLAISFAFLAHLSENLIEMVNILGSIFYGNILGIFLVAFFIKFVKGNAIFYAAVLSQLIIFYLFLSSDIGYLWFNLIGCTSTMVLSTLFQTFLGTKKASE
ncbi:MAG: sodium:solute symporter, partial [Cyclobacteriaceae bacterium]|nr:sodium:solute symporter [Cyclobacteriaceae bacterium]